MSDDGHVPVLLEEAVAALAVTPDGSYVDATFGRGGHARAVLERLGPGGRLVAVDRDPAAEAVARTLAAREPRFVFRRAWFSELPDVIAELALPQVDGVLLDLGHLLPADRRRERAASLFGTTVRSTCEWTRRAANPPPNFWPARRWAN